MKLTKPQRRALEEVIRRQKGWSVVGIPLPAGMARRLVDLGVAEWAAPMWQYPKPVSSVRLTLAGRQALSDGEGK